MQQILLDRVLNPIAKLYEDMSDRVRGIIFSTAVILLLLYNVFRTLLLDCIPYMFSYTFGTICVGVALLAMMKPHMKPIAFRKFPLVLWLTGGTLILVTSLLYNFDWLSEALLVLAVCPVAYIVWGTTDQKRLLRLLSRACVTSFLVHMIVSALLVPVEDRQYAGLFNNVNGAGQYLVLVFACLMIECLRQHRRKWVGALCFVWLGMCSALIFYTNSRTGLASAVVAFFVVLGVYLVREWRKAKKEVLLRILCMVLSIAVMLPTTIYLFRGGYMVSTWMRDVLTVETVTDTDVNQGGVGSFFEYAKTKTKITDKDMDAISTGRTSIWKAYLSHSALFGSDVEESFFVESRNANYSTAHMIWITYAFRHGYVCAAIMLLYTLVMGVLSLVYAWRGRGDPWSLLPLAITVVFGITSLLASINTPYNYILTIYYYFIQTLLIGKGFKKDRKKDEKTVPEN